MQTPFAILRVVGKALLNAAGGGFTGDVIRDVLPDVARDVGAWWREERTPEQLRAELPVLAQAPPAEVEAAVRQVVAELAGDRPIEVQDYLSRYLLLVPAAVRRSLSRPADAGALAERLAALLAPAPAAAAPAAAGGDETCPVCGGPMKVRQSKYGAFLGCAGYPRCRGTRRLPGAGRDPARGGAPPVPRDLPREVHNSVGMRLVLVPAGTFLMGSPDGEARRAADEGPRHRVTITRPFYAGAGPVTQQEYEAVMGFNPAHFRAGHGGGPRHPVEQVSWGDAVAFCRRLSALPAEKEANRGYRLPTEAEWEHACRAGTDTPFSCGASLGGEQANFDGSRPFGGAPPRPPGEKTTEVGSYGANAWGLFDVHGNVWEWCADWYDQHCYRASPGSGPARPARGDRRVVRGGSWNTSGHLCRSARRHKYAPDFCADTIGFRVVLVV